MSGPFGSTPHNLFNTTGFYNNVVNQSLRFDNTRNTYLNKTYGTAQTNTKKITASFWIKLSKISTDRMSFLYARNGGAGEIKLNSHKIYANLFDTGYDGFFSNSLLRDASSWYHIVYQGDSTLSTASARNKVYLNGVQLSNDASSYTQLNTDTNYLKNGQVSHIGRDADNAARDIDGYMAELHVIDGSVVAHTEFGETKDGVWIPKEYSGSHGNNGFYMTFANSGTATTSDGTTAQTNIGDDQSGNGRNFAVNNHTSNDVVPDSPENNFCTIIPMANVTESEGNLKVATSRTGNWDGAYGTHGVKSGKWYYEAVFDVNNSDSSRMVAGWVAEGAKQTVVFNGKGGSADPSETLSNQYAYASWLEEYYKDGSGSPANDGTAPAASDLDIIQIAADFDNNKMFFGINGTYYANDGGTDGNPAGNSNESISGVNTGVGHYTPWFQIRSDGTTGSNVITFNFGQDSSFAGQKTAQGNTDGKGFGDFYYTPPTGFLAVCSANLTDTEIGPNKGQQSDDNFNTILYTADGNPSRSITGVGFQPDWLWVKSRNNTYYHGLWDSVRTNKSALYSNATDAEDTSTAGTLGSLDADGFTTPNVSGGGFINIGTTTYVAWAWKAGGAASSNGNGTITSSVSANQDAGFSIVTYTGDGNNGATVGHGLSAAPDWIIIKSRVATSADGNWLVYHSAAASDAETDYLLLNSTAALTDQVGAFNDTAPTNTVFSLGTFADLNQDTKTYVAYCFHDVEGFSKFGTYTGNGDADGPHIFLGFRPAWIMIRNLTSGEDWEIWDAARDPSNVMTLKLDANNTGADVSSTFMDFVSNGVRHRNTSGGYNSSGGSYVYMAFAEAPFKYANAR